MRTLQVFPDSGHRTVFLPLYSKDADKLDTMDDAPNLSDGARDWLMRSCVQDDWRTANGKPWLMGRFAIETIEARDGTKADVYGFWVAVETNTGTPERGYVMRRTAAELHKQAQEKRPVEQKDDGDDSVKITSAAGPYVATSAKELTDALELNIAEVFQFHDKLGDVDLTIEWVREAGSSIPVDIIVDFGNSRTVVLGLERSVGQQGFTPVCRPILFPNPLSDVESLDYDVTNFDAAIPDSWFTLMETVFPEQPTKPSSNTVSAPAPVKKKKGFLSGLMGGGSSARPSAPERTSVTPHVFREISPAVIGTAAKDILAHMSVEGGGMSFLSSPKRYVWDDTPTGANGKTHWTMSRQNWRTSGNSVVSLKPLEGEITRFMANADADWSLDSWPYLTKGEDKILSNHSRADSLVWVALSILEQAYKQIQSEPWRHNNQPFLRRELGDILLTYPAGWTEAEIDVFRDKWAKARDIFLLSRAEGVKELKTSGEIPRVALELDEAVSPQLAFVFSEMRHMRDYGENWIDLYGRKRGDRRSVRVMTIDIGGGTTDTSVVEYFDELPGVGVDLSAKLLFKDSTTVAGDRLVKDLTERVLLPLLGERFATNSKHKALFERLFYARTAREGDQTKWSVITRTVVIPIIHHWLRSFNASGGETIDWTPIAAGASPEQIAQLNQMGHDFGLKADILSPTSELRPDDDMMRKTIQDWFLHIAEAHARYLAIFECDLVMLTGKPSELPEIRELLERRLPITSDRILSAKGYYAGDWLPMSPDGKIVDAKLVTALGTAVYRSVQSGQIGGWRIQSELDETCRIENYWGRIAGNLKPFLDNDILLAPGEDKAEARLLTDSFIGRARFLKHVLPEQVYRLEHDGREQVLVDVKIRRKIVSGDGDQYSMAAEALELVSAKNAQTGQAIPLSQIRLQLCTLPRAEEFWQDTGRFEVRWPL